MNSFMYGKSVSNQRIEEYLENKEFSGGFATLRICKI